ncbi:hypothetical protein CVT26_012418 [Gymnopilus dilepis]|uniref:Uncharacterized protein n=1 Tax=Gymnopilus dilepis TaxID=231916 RepID=A0A409YWD3_9AGAR|nr:hypothetical protein CVT26_012418 [Gymnopilus dilepis]
MSSSSLSPPLPDSSELSRVDEEDEADADEDLAISTLELSPPLSTATPTSRDWEHHDKHQEYETRYHLIEEYPPQLDWEHHDKHQEYETRYHLIEEYPPQLYNIPPDCHSPPPPSESSSPTSHVSHLPPLGDNVATTDSLPLDPLRPPSPLNFSPCHRTEHEPAETAHPQRACGGELPSLLSPLDRPPSPSPPTSVSSSLARPASAILSPAVPPLSSPDPQAVRLTDEPGLDDLGLGLLSPAVSTVELPPLFSSSSPFYDFGDGPAPESPSRRRSTDLPLLEEDNSDGGFSPFSSVFSSPASEYSDLGSFRHPDGHQRSHFLSLPGSDTDDDLIPPELASKNYSARSLLMWDEDGSIEYPVEGFGFRRSNYGYPPRSPSPDLLDLDPKKIEELGGGEEGRRVWEARQRAARDETLAGLGVGYGNWSSGEREGVDRRSLGRERRRELSALLRLKLGLLEDKDQADKPKTDNSNGGAPPPTPSPAAASLAPVIASSSEPEVTLQTSTSSGSPKATPSAPSTTSSTPSASPPARHSPSTKPRITSMAQLVANMVFHRQQHPHSTLGHVHDQARPKKSSLPTRSRTWASGDLLPGGHDQPEIAGVDAPGLLEPSTPARSQTLSTSKTPTSPLRHMTLPEDLSSDDSSDDEGSGNAGGEAHSNKTPTSTTLSPLFLCASPLSYSAAELEA